MENANTVLSSTTGIVPGMFVNVAAGPENTAPDYKLKTNSIYIVARVMGKKALLVTSILTTGHAAGDLETVQIGNKSVVIVDSWTDQDAYLAHIRSLHDFSHGLATGEKKAWNAEIYEKARRTVAMLIGILPEEVRPVLPVLEVAGGSGQRLVAVRPDVLAQEIADQVIQMAGKRLALAIVQMANDQRNGR